MIRSPHIVSTRRLNSRKFNELQQSGWRFTAHDFIRKAIRIPVDIRPSSVHKNVVLTSSTGAKAFLQMIKQLQLDIDNYVVYCISPGTKEYVLASGLTIKSTAPHASALADEILLAVEAKEVTHIRGNLSRPELSEKLTRAGVVVQEVMTYRTELTPIVINLPYEAIIFFSPSAINSFLSRNDLQQVPCFCIGQTTADYAKQKGYKHTYIPDAPSEEILLKTIVTYYTKNPLYAKE